MRRLPILIPHRPGCADFPLPVLHGRASLAEVQMTPSVTCRQRKTRGRTSALVSILASSASGGADDTIRDLPAKKDSREDVRPRFHSCQFSYPLSFRGQVCEAQGPLPCFPSTVLSAWHPSFLGRVPVSPVPRFHRYY